MTTPEAIKAISLHEEMYGPITEHDLSDLPDAATRQAVLYCIALLAPPIPTAADRAELERLLRAEAERQKGSGK